MAFVALKHLRWGDETIAPGDPVPEGEEGRDYASLLRTGQIERVAEPKPKARAKPKADKASGES